MDTALAARRIIDYLKIHNLMLTAAESCTAGRISALISKVPGSGPVLESAYVVYSPSAKKRLLNVSTNTMDSFGLTSEAVAREMAIGALRDSPAQIAVATTGVAGPDPMDGISPGTVCFAWAFTGIKPLAAFTKTCHFLGDREAVMDQAAIYALTGLPEFHKRWLNGESG